MIKLEKNKKTGPCTILPPLFLIFQICPPLGDVIKTYFPFLKKRGRGEWSELCLTKVNDGLIDLDRDAKSLLGFLEEKLKTLMYIRFSLLWKFSDKIQNCSI